MVPVTLKPAVVFLVMGFSIVSAVNDVQHNGFGNAVDGQVAGQLVVLAAYFLEGSAFEAERTKLSRVEEIRAFQVVIALFVAGADSIGRRRTVRSLRR